MHVRRLVDVELRVVDALVEILDALEHDRAAFVPACALDLTGDKRPPGLLVSLGDTCPVAP